jgi:hypothetical protein
LATRSTILTMCVFCLIRNKYNYDTITIRLQFNTLWIQLQYLGTVSEYNIITLKYGLKFNIIVLGQP